MSKRSISFSMMQGSAMATNAFIGKINKPTESELKVELGSRKADWDQLLEQLAALGADILKWNSYSRKAGWSLKVLQKKRVIVYLSPLHGGFRASFALGDRAIQALRLAKLPANFLTTLEQARRYAEGTAVRIEVSSRSDVDVVLKIAKVKIEY